MSESPQKSRLTMGQKTTFGLPSFAMNLSGALFGGWLTYFYLPPEDAGAGKVALVAASAFAVAQLVGRIVDAIADPLVGYWSDRSRNRMGRRLPFLLFGGPVLAISFLALWFPPFAPGSLANSSYLVATLCFYWFAFTLVVAPYFALIPEIATSSQERVHLSSSMAIFTVLGLAVGLGAVGTLQSNFKDGITILSFHIPSGIQIMAVLASLSLLVLFWAPLINIRERAYSEEKAVPKGLFKGLAVAFKNPAFRTYLAMAALIQMGLTMVIASIPYLTTQVLAAAPGEEGLILHEDGESWAGALQATVVVLAALCIPLVTILTNRLGKRRLFVIAGIVMTVVLTLTPATGLFPDPAIPAILLFVALAFPVSTALVLPNAIYGDVVDFEAARTGVRREGTYTGATALLTKAGIGLAQAAVVGLLALGNTRGSPIGIYLCFPAGAVFVAIGTWVFSKHPIDT